MTKVLTAVMSIDPLPGELATGLLSFLWGFWVYLPMPTLDSGPVFRALPEYVWGLPLALVGLAQLRYAVVRLLYGRRNITKRERLALAASALWVFLMVSIAVTSITSTAIPVYFCISLISAVVKVSLNGRHA